MSHYQVVGLIGTGGSGNVYRARDMRISRCVAIKTLKSGCTTARNLQGLRMEATALARLAHPQIARFHELITDAGRDFIVMEFVPGATLRDVMKTGPLPTAEVIRLGLQMMKGLAAAHAAGVVHRDIKPGNLKITSSGELKILDFGLAKLRPDSASVSTATDSSVFEIVGTAPYMAPERLRGERADERADIFSAGAVLYEMATGQRAFVQRSLPQLIAAILLDPPPSPRAVHPFVPELLSRIITRMLEKELADRYSSACVVIDELQALARMQQVEAIEVSA